MPPGAGGAAHSSAQQQNIAQTDACPRTPPPPDQRDTLGLVCTPISTNSGHADYKYYCPICMVHFKSMYRSSCCSQYMCEHCLLDQVKIRLLKRGYAESRAQPIAAGSAAVTPDQLYGVQQLGMPPSDCPFCSACPFRVVPVGQGEAVRKYVDSPAVRKLCGQTPGGPSPIRSGASWDEMASKMRRFPAEAEQRPKQRQRRQPLTDVDSNAAQQPRPPPVPPPPFRPVPSPPSAVPSPPDWPPRRESGQTAVVDSSWGCRSARRLPAAEQPARAPPAPRGRELGGRGRSRSRSRSSRPRPADSPISVRRPSDDPPAADGGRRSSICVIS
eukprot:TRINITY_DN1604_c2_g1_i3.p1 TRINITY_DN1604_c2_g1~~TRINITY_DN1604_c2_g1_i3.p1  ORF type:complete len:329 (+),score=92.75 TRINITY_DN1604_c2_g1_i3:79-1065(+)